VLVRDGELGRDAALLNITWHMLLLLLLAAALLLRALRCTLRCAACCSHAMLL